MKKTIVIMFVVALVVFCSSCRSTRIDMLPAVSETVSINAYEESETNKPVSFAYPTLEAQLGLSWKYGTLLFGFDYLFDSPGRSATNWEGSHSPIDFETFVGFGPRYELLDGKIELCGGILLDLITAQNYYREVGSVLQEASNHPTGLGLFLKTKFVIAENENGNAYIGFNLSAMPGHMTYTYRNSSQDHSFSYTRSDPGNLSQDAYLVKCSIGIGGSVLTSSLKKKK